MSFNLKSYVNTVKKAVRADAPKLREAAGDALYYALCATPLLALGQLGSTEAITAGAVALVGSVGGNLLANVAQKVKDEGQTDVPDILSQAAREDGRLLEALDNLLAKVDVIAATQKVLAKDEQAEFMKQVEVALDRMGSQLSINAQGAVIMGSVTAQGNFIGRDQIIHHHYYFDGTDHTEVAQVYLGNLRRMCVRLPLADMGKRGDAESSLNPITLDQVFVNLEVRKLQTELERQNKLPVREPHRERDADADLMPARTAVLQHQRVLLHGAPGSGKSALVRQLVADMCSAQLGETTTLPLRPPLHELCPVVMNLRDFAEKLKNLGSDETWQRLGDRERETQLKAALWLQWESELDLLESSDFKTALQKKLSKNQTLLIFDGLDEVTTDLRSRVREAIRFVFKQYGAKQRVIVTIRTRSLEANLLPDFAVYALLPFNDEQIASFSQIWYAVQVPHEVPTPQEAIKRGQDLVNATKNLDLERELVSNPLLLTVMAIVHQHEAKLPKERVALYDKAIEILLERWQRNKKRMRSAELQKLFEDDARLVRLKGALRTLAYEAHQHQAESHRQSSQSNGQNKAADLTKQRIETLWAVPQYLKTTQLVDEFLSYVDDSAGLLVGNGGKERENATYAFVHRTFQEYLAGCFMMNPDRRLQTTGLRLYKKKAEEGDYWERAAHLGAEEQHFGSGDRQKLFDLMYALSEKLPVTCDYVGEWRQALWAANIALLDLESSKADAIESGNDAFFDTLKANLLTIMRQRKLPVKERAAAGRALAKLGDPRREVTTVEAMRWVCIPKGPFIRGSDKNHDDEKPQMRVNVADDYYLSQYPVTQAQYAQFVAAQGYAEPRWWGEAKEAGYWQADKGFKGRNDDDFRTASRHYGEPFSLPNHPVVGVSWYEAVAFTRWLNEEVKNDRCVLHDHQAKPLTGKFEIRLPSETEWEKAARGTKDARAYGWGDTPNPDLANYDPTGLGATSAVGCFPNGDAHEFAVEEMSGNVWEWCITPWQSSYKDYDDTKNIKNSKSNILRGGSWLVNFDNLRVSFRDNDFPGSHSNYVGFRLLALPIF